MNQRHGGWAAVVVLSVLLAGCGGGGGGDSPAPTPNEPSPAADRTRPLALTTTNMADAATLLPGMGELTLTLAQYSADLTQRFASSGASATRDETCPNGGLLTLNLTDRDSDGRVSAGDSVIADLRDCGVPLVGEVLNGRISIDLVAATGLPTGSLRATMSLPGGLEIVDTSRQGVVLSLQGSFGFDWSPQTFRTTLSVTPSAADDFRFMAVGSQGTIVEAIHTPNLSKSLRFDQARSVISMDFVYQSDLLGGSLTVSTPSPIQAYLNTYPETGSIEFAGAGGARLRLVPNFVSASDQFKAELDSNNDGTTDATTNVAWMSASVGFLWWDGAVAPAWNSATFSTRNYLTTDFTQTLSYATPVSVSGPYRLQFSREPASTTTLFFRFADNGSNVVYDPVLVNVDADVQTQGAVAIIRPKQQLRHGRNYNLQISVDGVNWNNTVVVQDSLGNLVTFYGGSAAYVSTPDSLRAKATLTGGSLLSATVSVELSAATSISTNRPIASYHWAQLSGTPLSFSAPDAVTTQVSWGGTPPVGVETIPVELTVTDTAGEVERVRINVTAANVTTASKVLYYRSMPGDYIGAGQTEVLAETTGSWGSMPVNSGYVALSYTGNSLSSGSWWYLNFATADGTPLKVGSYENAVRAPFHGGNNGLEMTGSGRGCNQIAGRYTVLEVQTDGSGIITRLAIDFEQHCEGPQAPPLYGSLRINSTIAITQ
jgi:hypothetical protein